MASSPLHGASRIKKRVEADRRAGRPRQPVLAVFAEAADAERLLATTAPFKPAAASVAGITDDLSATVFAGATTPIESSSTATDKSSPANTTLLTMLLLRYSGEHAAKAALQATRKVNGDSPQVELVFESAKNGRRRVISPTQGVAAFAKGAVVGWAAFGVAAGLIAGFAGDGGILSSIESGVVTGVIWGIFGLFAGSIYGEWEGRAVSARRLKGIGRLLPPDSSMILAWADGTVDPGTAGKLSTPAAQTLQVRFNPVDHGALLEV